MITWTESAFLALQQMKKDNRALALKMNGFVKVLHTNPSLGKPTKSGKSFWFRPPGTNYMISYKRQNRKMVVESLWKLME